MVSLNTFSGCNLSIYHTHNAFSKMSIVIGGKGFTNIAPGVYIPSASNFGDKPERLKVVSGRKVSGRTLASLSYNKVKGVTVSPTKNIDSELTINIQVSSQQGYTAEEIFAALAGIINSYQAPDLNVLLSGGYPSGSYPTPPSLPG